MDVLKILEHVREYAHHPFKIGFVGNGEPFLDIERLKEYVSYIGDHAWIRAYTITNGTISLCSADYRFLEAYQINVGFSLDGYRELHNLYRGSSFDLVMENARCYRDATGHYPTWNATVGRESLENADRVIEFFVPFHTRVTFSRMIGPYGISLEEYRNFVEKAEKSLSVRRGGFDCTMYGGLCGAGRNNYFFANGKVYLCGNCIDLPTVGSSDISFYELEKKSLSFDRTHCYKEAVCG